MMAVVIVAVLIIEIVDVCITLDESVLVVECILGISIFFNCILNFLTYLLIYVCMYINLYSGSLRS